MTTMNKAAIAERIALARKAAKLSQSEVARRLKWHRPTISEIEAGRRNVRATELEQFAQLYGCEVGWFITGKGQGPRDPLTAAQARIAELEGRIERAKGILIDVDEFARREDDADTLFKNPIKYRNDIRAMRAMFAEALTILQEETNAPKS